MPLPQALLLIGIEAAAWFVVPGTFLTLYVGRYSVPADAILPHLALAGLALVAFALTRVAIAALVRSPSVQRLTASVVVATALSTIALYYVLVLLGLTYWGRVISWDLITGYAANFQELADALEVSVPGVIGAVGLAYALLIAAAFAYFKRLDWAPTVVRRVSRHVLAIGVFSGFLAIAIEIYAFLAAPPTQRYEPVSLTFFPLEGAWQFQNQAIDPLSSARFARLDDDARAAYLPAAGVARRNVVLIVVDALRPDHMGIYGYGRDTTPNLDRLARAGAVRKAHGVHSVCASSSCGLIALASSKFVHEFHNRPFTLQEVLKRHGYRIHLFLGGDHTHFYGLRSAYGEADSYFDGAQAARGFLNDDRALVEHVASFPDSDGTPVMLQFHLMSAHALGKHDLGRFAPAVTYLRPEGRQHGGHGINFYDNGVLKADSIIAELLEVLERKGYLQDAIVAITADHGEALGEHGHWVHSDSVREAALRIPFILVSYGSDRGSPFEDRRIASLVDVAPTILADLGMPPPTTWSGIPLQRTTSREFTYFQERSEVGLVDHRDQRNVWKYWIDKETGREYAFNLTADPREHTNAIDRVPARRLGEWRQRVMLAGARVETVQGAH